MCVCIRNYTTIRVIFKFYDNICNREIKIISKHLYQ